ncbi:acyl-CoA dehydrogenase family protein, partial [Streptomyces pristinaespiralis]|uniref:acyl-CoA dehydrogenase family protein n=1 Tax=Streptomyces pristinaespiralis TaxID=38300 RepID=UPI00383869E0
MTLLTQPTTPATGQDTPTTPPATGAGTNAAPGTGTGTGTNAGTGTGTGSNGATRTGTGAATTGTGTGTATVTTTTAAGGTVGVTSAGTLAVTAGGTLAAAGGGTVAVAAGGTGTATAAATATATATGAGAGVGRPVSPITPVTAPAPTTLFPPPPPAAARRTTGRPTGDDDTDQATTDAVTRELRHLLFDGDEQDTIHTPWRTLITHDAFLTHDDDLTPTQRTARSYQRLRLLNATAAGDPLALARDPRRLAALHEWTGIADSALGTLAGIHYNLFLGTLLDHDHPEHRDLTPYTTLRNTGTFLVTELAHGNDAAHLKTTAHHDPETGGFTLHTPTPGAAKFMPNTTTTGGPKTALVAARLITHDGTDRGIHLFLTPLHDENGLHPGIHITPLPPRHLPHPVDHAITTFTHVRLPPTALLQAPHNRLDPDGTHHTTHGNPQKRFLTTIDRVTLGKLCMSAAATGTARAALTIAVHYANHRHTTHHNTPTPLTTHRAHHAPLIDHLATTYALTLLHRHTLNHHTHHHHNGTPPPPNPTHPRYPTDPPPTKEQTHHLTALTKAFTTHHARTITTTCRERCGAWALHPHNPLAHYTQHLEGTITAEGDNLLITLKAATHLLLNPPPPPPTTPTPPNPLTNLTHLKNLLHHAQHIWHTRTKQALHTPTHPHTPHTRWNNATNPALTMTHLHTTLHTTNALLTTLNHTTHPTTHTHLKNLTNLYLLNQLTPHTADLITHHHLTPHHHNHIHTTINHLHHTLHPHLTTLTNALNHPHQHTPTPPPT